tara:strand:+ start:103 stop:357 length:255 start_codon:yes stop_codon:yes gene_type:complete
METPRDRRLRIEREHEEAKRVRAIEIKLRRSVRSDITSSGIMVVRYKLEHIIENPDMKEVEGLNHNTVVRVYNEAIDKYLQRNN